MYKNNKVCLDLLLTSHFYDCDINHEHTLFISLYMSLTNQIADEGTHDALHSLVIVFIKGFALSIEVSAFAGQVIDELFHGIISFIFI